ncbi:PhzF family phenazine biosynthesis protein [Litoreibacter roseus]|uniref:Diaminopimelate epimerase n=1 Tax=Litoreibacter roseus TaxID=2601869 RepID=A0A6N6JBC3_9RHOB|nr:PhzF family phenazine biosynthesis protein [Litoreibacter roseus]GFE63354.1 diaminopimelate epimerase [Litoreibacter roseus]
MTTYPFDWVDAFTTKPFGGNGCAVVYDDGALPVETCLAYTRETGLVECTFVGPSEIADLKVRYFLAEREIPFAGHPTIATVVSALSRKVVSGPKLSLETGAGVLEIDVSDDLIPQVAMTQNAPEFGVVLSADTVAAAVGLSADDIAAPPQVVSTGLPFVITILKDHNALKRAKLDAKALIKVREQAKHDDADMMEPYLVTLEGADDDGDTFARLLLAPPNPAEDPFTGSATGCAAAYLWHHGLIDAPDYVAQQGHWMGRPGQAAVSVLGSRDAIAGVKVTGQGRIVMRGDVLPV